jgi:hypothetical protein
VKKTIWSCWFQGREAAPFLVKRCFASWERENPGWDFRCLDAVSIERYVNLKEIVDLQEQSVTAASLSDIARVLLLHQFGGIWVDATLFCNRPLDDWLPSAMTEGFFAFAAPALDRLLASWFLSAVPNHYLISHWCRRTIEYWSNRLKSENYFWFHHLFDTMCNSDNAAADAWFRVPKISADGPKALQVGGLMFRRHGDVVGSVDWTTPVFKLTHRLSEEGIPTESLLKYLLDRDDKMRPKISRLLRTSGNGLVQSIFDRFAGSAISGTHRNDRRLRLGDGRRGRNGRGPKKLFQQPVRAHPVSRSKIVEKPQNFAALKVSTENLGDHIQIIAGLRLLDRLGIQPMRYIDRDNEIRSAPGLDEVVGSVGILLNGWFKTNRAEWPPHPKLAPLILGFHIRLFQCPELLSEASIEFFRQHQPIGCRDVHTKNLLRKKGVQAFTSNCLSLTFPRRIDIPPTQTEVFVVSRDERIKGHIPQSIGPYTFVSHYTGSNNFTANFAQAQGLLETYRSRAKLIITTLLHSALPAIAMGIPVVVFYPLNDLAGHISDRERFSSLEELVRIYRFDEIESVNWRPDPLDISEVKLHIIDNFYEMAARWGVEPLPSIGPLAPPSALPPS